MSTEHLVYLQRYAATRDPEDFRVLVDAYHAQVYQACWRVLGDAQAAQDATQETFLGLARHAGRITRNLPAWLHACAINQARQWQRSESRRFVREREVPVAQPVLSEAEELHGDIDEALSELAPADRDLLIRRFLRDEPLALLATEAGISVPAIHQRLQRAVESLRARLRRRGHVVPAVMLIDGLASLPRPEVPAGVGVACSAIGLAGIGPAAGSSLVMPLGVAVLAAGGLVAAWLPTPVAPAQHQPVPSVAAGLWQAQADFSAMVPWVLAVPCALPKPTQDPLLSAVEDLVPTGLPLVRLPPSGVAGDDVTNLAAVLDPQAYQCELLAVALDRDLGAAPMRIEFRIRLAALAQAGGRSPSIGFGGSWIPGREPLGRSVTELDPQWSLQFARWYRVLIEVEHRAAVAGGALDSVISVALDGRPWTRLRVAGLCHRVGLLSIEGARGWIDDLHVEELPIPAPSPPDF
jgi:RNA polymerase sigma factor (sigma-70 family)